MTLIDPCTHPAGDQASERLRIVIIGLTITSSWGNGHATTYRSLMRELVRAGHDVLFLEHDKPWYALNRDLPTPPYGRTELYQSVVDLQARFGDAIEQADLVIVGSYVPEGITVGGWVQRQAAGVKAFYDIDTPVTLARLASGQCDYLSAQLIPGYHLYLSFSGGPALVRLERDYGSPAARAFYCSVDPSLYFAEPRPLRWDLGYLGTYSADRQLTLERLLLDPARQWPIGRFVVAGPLYPAATDWTNVDRIEHLSPGGHRAFYNEQRFTLNVTRDDMIRAGYSPSVRLFEAAACGAPIISDWWEGLDTILEPGEEILIAESTDDALRHLRDTSEAGRVQIGQRARARILSRHTSAHRARELEECFGDVVRAAR